MKAQIYRHPLVYVSLSEMKSNIVHHSYITDSLNTIHLPSPSYDPYFSENNKIFQAMIFCEDQEELRYIKEFPNFKFTRWHPFSIDVDPAYGTKIKGVKMIKESLGYTDDQLIVFGDGLNDVEVIAEAKYGIAMGNGYPKAKEVADFVTNPINENGVLLGLQKLNILP